MCSTHLSGMGGEGGGGVGEGLWVREVCGNVACVRDRDAGQLAQLNCTEKVGLGNARQ